MRKKTTIIPVNPMADGFDGGVAIETVSMVTAFEEARQAHREDRHTFFLLERGTVQLEIDFETYTIQAPSVLYVHPDQVHRILAVDRITVSSWAINNESLKPDYLTLLETIKPAKPLVLPPETFSLLTEAVALCLKFAERKNDRLYHALLKDGANALVALVVSQYLERAERATNGSRVDTITKAFRALLEQNYATSKRPTEYAQNLNISTPYLNECVKSATGYSVSYHIQQRVILEAKRLLYHSDKSVKEIAAALGYDDYPYFSRLFTNVTGMTALAFRNTTLD